MRRCVRLALMVFAGVVLVPAAASAQASIAGVVRDTSGAVLPGATVEAASPALIEKVRSAVTDGTGQYKIENLRPGTYTVTFTLPGFNTVKREGIELTGTFTASVNADLRVGAIEETITVTGETPIVDVQNTTRQQVLSRELISAIPTSRNAARMAALLPSVTTSSQDVGGLAGESGAESGDVTVHGNTDVRTLVNGVSLHSSQGNGATGAGNIAAYQEMAVDTGGISAESAEGGVRMNLIPREGGNTFAGSFYSAFASTSMQSDNLTQDLKDRGLGTSNKLKKYYDINPSFGGPIKRDTVWFHATVRRNIAKSYAPVFFNKNAGNPNVWIYEPDTARGSVTNDAIWTGFNGRVTWQVTPKNKLAVAYDYIDSCECPRSQVASRSLEAGAGNFVKARPEGMAFVEWTAPITNRLLLEAGLLYHHSKAFRPDKNIFFTNDPGPVKLNGVQDQALGLAYRAVLGSSRNTAGWLFLPRMTMSYVTGAHAFKAGFNLGYTGRKTTNYSIDSPMSFRFNNGVPNRLTLQATPYVIASRVDGDNGVFVQDRWTVRRLTLTAGLRYNYFHGSFPETTVGPGQFVPTRNLVLPATEGATFHDLSPRSGLAFDVFGNGKTALKVSLNKYLAFLGLSNSGGTFTTDLAPASRLVNSTNRSWRDADRDFVPDCNLTNPVANGECGDMSNPDFGSTRPGLTYDPDTLSGWGKRDYNWQFSAGVQHELVPRVSVDISYFRTWFGNFVVTDDRAISAADFDTFSITAPSDPRLPGGGGQTVSGLYDLKPAAFGRAADNYLTYADNYGKQIKHWNGVDVAVNARPHPSLTVQGGTSTGRTTTDNCEVVAKLPERLFGAPILGDENDDAWLPASTCRQQSAFLTQAKFIATYTVPRIDVTVSGTLQNRPGPRIAANYTATNAVISPSLGRNLSGGANNIVVDIVEPGTLHGARMNQIDLRIGKILKFGRTRMNASVDLYNALNANPVLTLNNAFGSWQTPQSILNPRFAKVVVQLDF